MSCSKQFSTTDMLGLDLYKVLSSATLQMPVFSINVMRLLIKILNMRGPRIEPWGIPVKISIHSLIADPIFTLSFYSFLWNNFRLMLSKPYASNFAIIKSWGR